MVNTGQRNAIRVEAELESIKLRVVPNGFTRTSQAIPLKKNSILFISTYEHSEIEDKEIFSFTTTEKIG